MIDFVNYTPPTGAEWARLQKMANYNNQEAATVFDVSVSEIKRYRDYKADEKGNTLQGQKPSKGTYFLLCILADVAVVLYDEPEEK